MIISVGYRVKSKNGVIFMKWQIKFKGLFVKRICCYQKRLEYLEKTANFLYLIAKNHSFIDGNKRIAATLFIAQSDPKEKEILVDLVMNFLVNEH